MPLCALGAMMDSLNTLTKYQSFIVRNVTYLRTQCGDTSMDLLSGVLRKRACSSGEISLTLRTMMS